MNKLRLLISSCSIIFFFFSIIASDCLPAQSKPTQSHPNQQLPISETEKITLDNGLTLLLKKVPTADIVSIIALIKSGSAREGKFLGSGIAHLTEHMLFKDEPEKPKSEIAKQVSLLGGQINGSTSYDWTSFSISLPKENAKAGLELLYEFLMKPQFFQEDLEKEKQVVLKEINLIKDNPERLLWNLLMETAFRKHPYRYPIIGYENLLKRITLDDLRQYYHQTYIPQNIILSIAGDFDEVEIKEKIKKLFSKEERALLRLSPDINEPEQNSMKTAREELNSTTFSHAALAYRSVSVHHRDMYALDVLASILGQGKSSRLNQKLKENLKIVYSIATLNYTPADPGLFVITFVSEPENQQKANEQILSEIENIKNSEVSKQELKKAKQSIKSDFLFSKANCNSLASSIAHNEATLGNPDFDQEYLNEIENVTIEDLGNVANKYLNFSSLSSVSLTPPSAQEKISKQRELTIAAKPEIKKSQLTGGLKVLLLEDSRLPIVNIRVAFLGGLLAEKNENNGISEITSRLLLKGTKTKTAYEISSLIESWGGSIEAFSGNNSFGLSLGVLKENLEPSLKLLSQILRSPAFEIKEINKERELLLAQLKKQKEDIFTIGSLALRKELYLDHPYSLNKLGRSDSLKNLKREAILNFYSQHIRKPNMIISVFGDIDNQHTLKLIKKLFSNLSAEKVSVITNKKINTLDKKITQFEILEKEQSLFMLGFRICSLNNPDKYVLDIISEVLSGLDGRLFRNIREELAIAYTLGGYNSEFLQGGHFTFYVATTENYLKKAKDKIWQEIKTLKKESITEEELKRAKRSLIGKKKISLQTNAALAFQATLDELYGLGFNNYKNYESQIEAITTKKVKQVLNKYFNDNFVEIFVSPSSFLLQESASNSSGP